MTDSKTATLLLAHGSSDANWLAPFSNLLTNIRKGLEGERVELSYMELAEPSMEGQIIKLADNLDVPANIACSSFVRWPVLPLPEASRSRSLSW